MNKEQKTKIREHLNVNGSPELDALGVVVAELLNKEGKLPAFYAETDGNVTVSFDMERLRALPNDTFHDLVSQVLSRILKGMGFGMTFTSGLRISFDDKGDFNPVGFGIGFASKRLYNYPITGRSLDYLDEHAREVLAKLAGALVHADIKREDYEP
jgi:hypothetical protein